MKRDEYWSYTAAYTDLNSKKFLNLLKTCLDFIDRDEIKNDSERYSALQDKVKKKLQIGFVSTRKAINHLVKLGFIDPFLKSYTSISKKYLNADNEERKIYLSRILHLHCSFNSSVKKNTNDNHLNFLIRTLSELGELNKDELITLFQLDIKNYKNGYIDQDELNKETNKRRNNGFIVRKKNQFQHFTSLINKMDDLDFSNDLLRLKRNALSDRNETFDGRDPYQQRLYKNNLRLISKKYFKKEVCMLEGLEYPTLIASHIKSYKDCEPNEQFDTDNGLLLSRNMDELFDKKHISFDNSGKMLISKQLSIKLKNYLQNFSIDSMLLNTNRKDYLRIHRIGFYNKEEMRTSELY